MLEKNSLIELTQPDDWHVHLRSGKILQSTVPDIAQRFGRAIVMPNLKPPITNVQQASNYRQQILAAIPAGSFFEPLMTLYLTNNTTAETIIEAARCPFIHAVKLYPAGATTHSDAGVTDIAALYPIFDAMQEINLPLLIHGEVIEPSVDVFDREERFISDHLLKLTHHFPKLQIVLEHISSAAAVDFILNSPATVAATITAHHLLLNRNDLLVGGIKPHYYCLPIVKTHHDQSALLRAATSGNPKFFLGTDSAPHPQEQKESACGCAGIYTAHAAIELYAEAFEQIDALDKLEGFASHFGADFYGLPRNQKKITLIKQPQHIPQQLDFGDSKLIPFRGGETVAWSLLNTPL